MSEEGEGCVVDEHGVNGDSTAEARYRSGDAALLEREVNARATLLLNNGAGT